MMDFTKPIPEHHSFKGKRPKKILTKKPFISEINTATGEKVTQIYTVTELKYPNHTIEVWTDGNNNYWIQLVE